MLLSPSLLPLQDRLAGSPGSFNFDDAAKNQKQKFFEFSNAYYDFQEAQN